MTSPMSETSLIYKWNESNEACREGNILPAASGCDRWGSRAAGTGPASWWSSGYRRGGRTAQWRRSPSRRGTPGTHCPRSPTAAWLQTWPLPVQPFTKPQDGQGNDGFQRRDAALRWWRVRWWFYVAAAATCRLVLSQSLDGATRRKCVTGLNIAHGFGDFRARMQSF